MVRATPVLTGLLLLIAGMNVGFSGPSTAGIPLLAAANGWGASGASLLIGAFGVGAAVSGLGLLLIKQVPGGHPGAADSAVGDGMSIVAVGAVHTLLVAVAAAVACGWRQGSSAPWSTRGSSPSALPAPPPGPTSASSVPPEAGTPGPQGDPSGIVE